MPKKRSEPIGMCAVPDRGFRCGVCGDRWACCANLAVATPTEGLWCPNLETALEARQQGLWRNKNGRWSERVLKRNAQNRHKYPCPYPQATLELRERHPARKRMT